MPYPLDPLHTIRFDRGFAVGHSRLAQDTDGYSFEGSSNAFFLGQGYWKPFRGAQTQGAGTGSRLMRPLGETWGGIKDVGVTHGAGSISEEINRSVWGIGAGQVHREGVDIASFTLSTLLKVSIKSGGTYAAPVTAGLAQPSALDIGISSVVGDVDGAVSAKLEWHRPATGDKSLASPTSAVIVPQGNQVRVTFPTAPAGGSGIFARVFFTLQRFGGQGIHYATPYSGSIDIAEATIAAGTVDGIARSLLFNFKDADLVPIEASYDDYTPQPATHEFRIENVMCLPGSFSDASTSPSSTSTGSAIQVSKENAYGSYVPTSLLFLPERVVDVLSRPIDSHAFVGCENSISAVQYVGPREDLPSCVVTTVLQDQGIKNPWNWCHFKGRLAVITAEGNWLLMSEDGSIDTEWNSTIRRFVKDWSPDDTVIGYDPKNDCLVIFNGRVAITWSIQNGNFGNPFYLGDYGITAGAVSTCVTAKRRLYFTVKDGVNFTAYEWDTSALTSYPVAFVSHFSGSPSPSANKNIYQLATAAETSNTDSPVVIALAKNLEKLAFRNISVTTGDDEIVDADLSLKPFDVGKQ
jgi:hypothetical protein